MTPGVHSPIAATSVDLNSQRDILKGRSRSLVDVELHSWRSYDPGSLHRGTQLRIVGEVLGRLEGREFVMTSTVDSSLESWRTRLLVHP